MGIDTAKVVRAGWFSILAFAALAATGCSASGGLVGTWETDRTQLIGSPSEENQAAEFFAPVPKFRVQFTKEGTVTSSWDENGVAKSKTGTWQVKEDKGLGMIIVVKFPPAEDDLEMTVLLTRNNRISLESNEDFDGKIDGPFNMKRPGT